MTKLTTNSSESLDLLGQIADSMSKLSGTASEQRALSDELYQQAIAVMIGATPVPFQRIFTKIQTDRIRIGYEAIKTVISSSFGEDLSEEEERLYRESLQS
jgi:hypothetical protein